MLRFLLLIVGLFSKRGRDVLWTRTKDVVVKPEEPKDSYSRMTGRAYRDAV